MADDSKIERISIRITPEFKERAKKVAKKENRTLSNWCENVLLERLEELEKKQ